MEKKINIAELLKDCPRGMQLDCTSYNNVSLDKISADKKATYPIFCYITDEEGNRSSISFTENGCESKRYGAKCVIFPKDKTTWEGFAPPCQFKDGDIIFTHANCLKVGLGNTWISIYQENRNGGVATYIDYAEDGSDYYSNIDEDKPLLCMEKDIMRQRLATEEEKQKLFDAIKDHGYKWNGETKTLEKLVVPKFKVGDRIKHISAYTSGIVVKVNDKGYHIDYPKGEGICYISFELEKDYELAPNKFDITTLKPFESRVLARDTHTEKWKSNFWGFYDIDNTMGYPYDCCGNSFAQCIPYEGNEHLLGKTDDCDDFYKTWE